MQRLLFLAFLAIILTSCGSSKKIQRYKYLVDESVASQSDPKAEPEATPAPKPTPTPKPAPQSQSKIQKVVKKAMSYEGTPYKYGGTTSKGMDCSGLVYTSYQSIGKTLPRVSRDMPTAGTPVKRSSLKKGDLVFFNSGGGRTINHVGIVVSVSGTNVQFIHTTTSKGVRLDPLNEGYWKDKYLKAVRIKV
ncbi:MAG: C40 family peptidase [Bacteroidota bacterium]